MYIKGIGKISQDEVAKILTEEAKKAIHDGSMTWDEAGEMYKLEQVKKASNIGAYSETFSKSFNRVPNELFENLSPKELAALTDAFHQCYIDGKKDRAIDEVTAARTQSKSSVYKEIDKIKGEQAKAATSEEKPLDKNKSVDIGIE